MVTYPGDQDSPISKDPTKIPDLLLNEHFNDRYFDVINAVEEARHIYFEGNHLLHRLGKYDYTGKTFHIGELGFGAGRTFAALLSYLNKSGLKNLDIGFHTVELYPLQIQRIEKMLEPFRNSISEEIDVFLLLYRTLDLESESCQVRTLTLPFGKLTFRIWFCEALRMMEEMDTTCDAWCLDGHGPKKNPEMWREEIIRMLGKRTVIGGTLATFTVAGELRRALVQAGFTVMRVPGFGGKNVVLNGIRVQDGTAQDLPKKQSS